jgi:hypothetical protein
MPRRFEILRQVLMFPDELRRAVPRLPGWWVDGTGRTLVFSLCADLERGGQCTKVWTLNEKGDYMALQTNMATTSFTSVRNEADLTRDVNPAHMATTSFTSVGSLADSPEPPLRPSPATRHAAEILDV